MFLGSRMQLHPDGSSIYTRPVLLVCRVLQAAAREEEAVAVKQGAVSERQELAML